MRGRSGVRGGPWQCSLVLATPVTAVVRRTVTAVHLVVVLRHDCLTAAVFDIPAANPRNYYDTLAKVFGGTKGVSQQLPALLKALPQNKRKLLQDFCDGFN